MVFHHFRSYYWNYFIKFQIIVQCDTKNLVFIGKAQFRLASVIALHELPHDKINKMTLRPAKTRISLGIRPVWSESSLSAWRKLGSLATHWVHSEDFDQTGRMHRLIWVFAGQAVTLLVFSWGGSYMVEHCLNADTVQFCCLKHHN